MDKHVKYTNKNEKFFDVIDSEIKAYLLGYFYADGYNHVEYNRIQFSQAKQDIETVHLFHKYLYPSSKITHIKMQPPRQDLYMFNFLLNICAKL